MLSIDDNELLTRVGPGTPMGELMRRYWIPALLSEEIAEPDCPPVRVKLLGEDLVAFRDSEGRAGFLAEHCSHRRASLFYGRNEECGLRCIYHGWKYDIEGNVVDTPAEPAGSDLKKKVHHPAYPTQEAIGIVFAYMGPREKMPLFPNHEWLTVPPTHVAPIIKVINENNFLQGLEGECDSSHLNYLHKGNDPTMLLYSASEAPSFEIEYTSYGTRAAAIRRLGDKKHFRCSCFVMPCLAAVPVAPRKNGRLDGFSVVYHVPADDYYTSRFNVHFKRSGPMSEQEIERYRDFKKRMVGPDFKKIANRSNDYLIDREKQKSGRSFTGIETFTVQDACVTEGMDRICDRTKENLGVSDAYVITFRRFLLKTLRDCQRGIDPPGVAFEPTNNNFSDINSIDESAPPDTRWQQLFTNKETHGWSNETKRSVS